MGDESVEQVEVIPTGSIVTERSIGCGGYPRGRIIEIYGPESSGKPRWQSMPSPKHKRQAASQHSSMRNTLSTASMQPKLV